MKSKKLKIRMFVESFITYFEAVRYCMFYYLKWASAAPDQKNYFFSSDEVYSRPIYSIYKKLNK